MVGLVLGQVPIRPLPPYPKQPATFPLGLTSASWPAALTSHSSPALVLFLRNVTVSCAPQTTGLDSHKQVVYFLERGVPVHTARQRLCVRGARLDLEEYELVASFCVQ